MVCENETKFGFSLCSQEIHYCETSAFIQLKDVYAQFENLIELLSWSKFACYLFYQQYSMWNCGQLWVVNYFFTPLKPGKHLCDFTLYTHYYMHTIAWKPHNHVQNCRFSAFKFKSSRSTNSKRVVSRHVSSLWICYTFDAFVRPITREITIDTKHTYGIKRFPPWQQRHTENGFTGFRRHFVEAA